MSFRHSSISSKDISCPQAYNINDDLSLQEASPTSLKGDQNHRSTSTVGDSATKSQDAPYRPGKWLYLAFATLAILTIMVALDATALSVALPVSSFHRSDLKAWNSEQIIRLLPKNFTDLGSRLSGLQHLIFWRQPFFSPQLQLSPMLLGENGSQLWQ